MGRKQHCSLEERRLVSTLRQDGQTIRAIAKALNRSANFVSNALKPKKATETRGKPKKTSLRTDQRIVTLAKMDPFRSSRVIAAEINNVVSSRTVRRRLVDANLPGRIARKIPLLRKKNFKSRMLFAKEHLCWSGLEGQKKWRNVLWSDETKINLFSNDAQRHVRRPKGKEFDNRYTQKTVKHGGGNIMVWGCFSWNGVGPIHRIKDIMTKFQYLEILQNTMLPYAEENMPLIWKYQQDNDPKHTSKLVKDWFIQENVPIMSWPSQSPDLNPIENLWGHLKKQLVDKRFVTKDQLWDSVQEIWYDIPVEMCRKLISSMPRRMEEVIKNKGGYTGY